MSETPWRPIVLRFRQVVLADVFISVPGIIFAMPYLGPDIPTVRLARWHGSAVSCLAAAARHAIVFMRARALSHRRTAAAAGFPCTMEKVMPEPIDL